MRLPYLTFTKWGIIICKKVGALGSLGLGSYWTLEPIVLPNFPKEVERCFISYKDAS